MVPSAFSRQQLNSETSRLRRRSFHSQKNGPTDFGRFRRLQLIKWRLSSQVITKNTHQNKNPFKVCEAFQLKKQKVSGRPSKPTVFGSQYQKNRILKPTKNGRQSAEKKRYQKNTPQVSLLWYAHDQLNIRNSLCMAQNEEVNYCNHFFSMTTAMQDAIPYFILFLLVKPGKPKDDSKKYNVHISMLRGL